MNKRPAVQSSKRLILLCDRIFFCPSCSTWRLPKNPKSSHQSRCFPSSRRSASTYSSATAINATKPVPPRLKSLYDAILDVKRFAPSHVNTSRLQLALQGLESSTPTIRLAILGLNVPDTARRVARLFLADPLEDEGQWEQQLAHGKDDYSRGLIIRYGREGGSGMAQPRNSVPILHVPAEVLDRHNLEILISSVVASNSGSSLPTTNTPADTFLSPAVGTPTSFEGRQTIISQPVHRTLLLAQGLDQAITIAQLLATTNFVTNKDRESIHVAMNLPGMQVSQFEGKTYIIDVPTAEEGLAAIRTSVTQATQYEHKWMASGMTELSKWMLPTTSADGMSVKNLAQPIQSLISAVLEAASINIDVARTTSHQTATEHSLTLAERTSLDMALDEFSRSAHQELQSGLASAWSSRNWRKLAWYKLFWRVDDVGLIVTDLVNSAWLPRTERAVYELSGRLVQVGINPIVLPESEAEDELRQESATEPEYSENTVPSYPLLGAAPQVATAMAGTSSTAFVPTSQERGSTIPILVNPDGTQPQIQMTVPLASIPLTSTISSARRQYIYKSTIDLTSTAQQLVLRTLSLAGLTGGLTLLTYFSSLSGTLYEAGTIFAVGTTYALWKMQSGWQHATRSFEQGLFTRGRDIIMDITRQMRHLVNAKSEVTIDPIETNSLNRAEHAVTTARAELDKITTQQTQQQP